MDITLSAVDETTLARLVRAARTGATAAEVTPPLTPGLGWSPARQRWLLAFHRDRRAGLDGPCRESTWAVKLDGKVVGGARLRRYSEESEEGEEGAATVGLWLTRQVRGAGVGRAALRLVLDAAAAAGVNTVLAQTTASNLRAVAVLRSLGFTVAGTDDGGVRGRKTV